MQIGWKKKVLLSLVLIGIILSSVILVSESNADQSALVNLTPSAISGESLGIGGNFTVTVQVSQVSNLWGWSLGLTWDPSVLQMLGSVKEGSFLKNAGQTNLLSSSVNNPDGIISNINDYLTQQAGASGSGDLASFTFKIVGYGSTQIKLANVQLLAVASSQSGETPQISSTVNDATFTFVQASTVSPMLVTPQISLNPATGTISVVKTGTTATSTVTVGPNPDPINTNLVMDIRIDNAAHIWEWNADIHWNPSVLRLTGVVEGTFLKSDGTSTMFIGGNTLLFDNTA
jgi:hypothetical protein